MFKGIVKLSKNGKGSLLVSEDLSFKLSRKELFKVFPGDKVECSVQQDKATIQKIIERNTTEVIGKLKKSNKGWIAESVNNEFHLEIVIKKNTSKKLKNGDFCKIKIKKQPSLKHRPEGYIVEQLIFSNIFEEADEIALQTNLNIKRTFPKTILPEINRILKEHNSGNFPSEYEDLTDKNFFTIDGKNAKDFDDAICCEQTSNGYKLLVAIADVSAFVSEGSSLDKVAAERATSIYLNSKVIPMLPKELSNDICSLRPLEKRLTLVCEMILDKDCSLKTFKFYSAIIESKKRFTYDELSNLEKDDIDRHPEFSNDLKKLLEICKKRIEKRKQRLAIDFEMNEYRPEVKKGKLKAFVPVTRYLSHKAIEECMILANISAAKFLKENQISTIFRFHDFPDMDKIISLQKFLQSRGLPISEDFNLSRKSIFDWVQKTSKHKINEILALEILKSMKLAIYSSERSEHFALGLDEYLHFTSPIRRYPDLVVHRCIKQIIHNKKFKSLSKNDLADIAENCSFREREADQISKEADKVLRSRCGQNYIGNKFSGIITGVTEFGVFVKLDQINIEGLCHISSFKNKYYNFNYEMKSLVSRQGAISIGDKMSCIIESVHPYEGKISLIPA